jgi:hypothetical protein
MLQAIKTIKKENALFTFPNGFKFSALAALPF